jgi:hypothetical protein
MLIVVLCIWMWVLAGCFALLMYAEQCQRANNLLEVALLALAWPWWLSHYSHGARDDARQRDYAVVPVDRQQQRHPYRKD